MKQYDGMKVKLKNNTIITKMLAVIEGLRLSIFRIESKD